jgi:hypothetical protein
MFESRRCKHASRSGIIHADIVARAVPLPPTNAVAVPASNLLTPSTSMALHSQSPIRAFLRPTPDVGSMQTQRMASAHRNLPQHQTPTIQNSRASSSRGRGRPRAAVPNGSQTTAENEEAEYQILFLPFTVRSCHVFMFSLIWLIVYRMKPSLNSPVILRDNTAGRMLKYRRSLLHWSRPVWFSVSCFLHPGPFGSALIKSFTDISDPGKSAFRQLTPLVRSTITFPGIWCTQEATSLHHPVNSSRQTSSPGSSITPLYCRSVKRSKTLSTLQSGCSSLVSLPIFSTICLEYQADRYKHPAGVICRDHSPHLTPMLMTRSCMHASLGMSFKASRSKLKNLPTALRCA